MSRAGSLAPSFVVGRRLRHDALAVLAAWLFCVIAATLLAAAPVYRNAIIDAAARDAVAEAPPGVAEVVVTGRTEVGGWVEQSEQLSTAIARSVGPDVRTFGAAVTDSYSIESATSPAASDDVVVSLATTTELASLVRVIDSAAEVPSDGAIAVSVHRSAAEMLGLSVGDRLQLTSTRVEPVEVEVVAVFEPLDPSDRLWLDSPLVRDGFVEGVSVDRVGPFLVSESAFVGLGGSATFDWRVTPEPSSLSAATARRLAAAAPRVAGVVAAETGRSDLDVAGGLAELLAEVDEAAGSTLVLVSVVLVQLVVVALFGLVLAAELLVSNRATATSLMVARGGGPASLAVLGLVEAVVLTGSAVVLAPFLAVGIVRILARWEPVAAAGLVLEPEAGGSAVLAASVAALLCVVVLVLPSVRAARAATTVRRVDGRSPAEFLRSTGLDLVLVAVSALGLWQLSRRAGSRSSGGIDPSLVVAPALAILGASLLFVRLVGQMGRVAERSAAGGDGVASLAASLHLARRSDRAVRSALLALIAMAVGTFTLVQGASWTRSQDDQARAQVPADLRVFVDQRQGERIHPSLIGSAYDDAGFVASTPFAVVEVDVGTDLERVPLVAVDLSAPAAQVLRSQLASQGTGPVLDDLAAAGTAAAADFGGALVDGADEQGDAAEVGPSLDDQGHLLVVDADATVHRLGPFEPTVGASPADVLPEGLRRPVRVLPPTVADDAEPYGAPLEVIVSAPLGDHLGLGVGDRFRLDVPGAALEAVVVGVVDWVPGATESAFAMFADRRSLTVRQYRVGNHWDAPTEWLVDLGPTSPTAAVAALRAAPFSSVEVRSYEARVAELTDDPTTIGVIGSLGLGLVASAVVAVIGVMLGAVIGARDRRSDIAVLRAIGVDTATIARWLLLEVGVVLVMGVLVGAGTGALLARIAGAALTLDRQGRAVVPAPETVIPVGSIAVLGGALAVLGVIGPLVTARLAVRGDVADALRRDDDR